MKKAYTLFFLLFVFILPSCSQSFPTSELSYTKAEKEAYIKSDTFQLGQEHSLHDFIILDDKIIATDSENDCLLIIDKDDGEIEIKGKTGGGTDEFLAPRGICMNNNSIYIVDSENKRIKILDPDLTFQKSIDLSEITFWEVAPTFLDDIAVNDRGDIFFTVNTCVKKDAKLYCIESGFDKPKVIMDNCTGVVTSFGNKTYFADTFELVDDTARSTGSNYIYEIENGEVKTAYSLPYRYAPMGIYAEENGIYCSSYGKREAAKINLNSLTAYSVFSEPSRLEESDKEKKQYGALFLENNVLWLAETNNNEIYKLTEG